MTQPKRSCVLKKSVSAITWRISIGWIMCKQEATFAQHAMPQTIHRKKLSQKSSPWTFECESVLQFDSYSLKENRFFARRVFLTCS